MSKKKSLQIALIRGPIVSTDGAFNNEAVPAISLAYLSAYIKQGGYKVSWIDAIGEGLNKRWPLENFPGFQCQGLTFNEIYDRIPQKIDVIGINAMFSGEWPVTRELINGIKERFPEATIVAGGEHTTALTEFTLRDCPAIDYCIRGEGERALLELLQALETEGSADNVAGVAYINNEDNYIEATGPDRIRELETIPWPYWPEGYLEDFWEAGKSAGNASARDMPMMISRGCPFQCTFCSSPGMWTTRYVLRDSEDVIKEIKHYIDKYAISAIQLYDLTAITKKKWTVSFCNRMIEENIQLNWSVPQGTRGESLDEETLSLLQKTGCNYLVYAPESGSPKTLEKIKKRITLKKLVQSVMRARRLGIVLRTNLIIGFPWETRMDVLRSALFGVSMAIRGVDEVSCNIFSPYPGSELFKELRAEGKIEMTDDYFLALTSLNSDFFAMNPLTFNEHMGPRELATYRLVMMLTNYGLSYLFYPWRILRTIRNVRSGKNAATVLEHRLRDMFRRKAPT